LRQLLAAECRVILGTDSRASNPDLDIWQEMQHVANAFPELSPGALMAMVTTHSAEAMGVDAKPFQIRQGSDFFPGFLVFDPSVSSVSQIMRHEQTKVFVA
jgi:cytosine/adenosine deaminase-related metal-dependent hydrolase